MSTVLIAGAGAAGMLAAISAASCGHKVHLYEKNEKLGKKLYITGKGRCNVCNAGDMQTVMSKVVRNPKFLYSAFREYSNRDIMDLLEEMHCPLKIERGGRVFPVSDHSSDVIKALQRKLEELQVQIHLHTEVKNLWAQEGKIRGLILKNGESIEGDPVIVCTGGLSYQTTGSTGDGYDFARRLGHRIVKTYPSLVPLTTRENDTAALQGLSLKNVGLELWDGQKLLYRDFGELLFTHFGLSGPLALSASAYATELLEKRELHLYIDLKPALDMRTLEQRVLRDFAKAQNKSLKNALSELFPVKLIPFVIDRAGLSEDKKVHDISKQERRALLQATKAFPFRVTGSRGFKEAVITRGGVDTKEVNPKTMESKLVKGLYFAGEVLDLDALTGGYNLQIAWSSAWSAGRNIEYV